MTSRAPDASTSRSTCSTRPEPTDRCGPGRVGLAGRGEALRLAVPAGDPAAAAEAVHAASATIEVDDEVGLPGTGPVALGALPFDPTLRRVAGRPARCSSAEPRTAPAGSPPRPPATDDPRTALVLDAAGGRRRDRLAPDRRVHRSPAPARPTSGAPRSRPRATSCGPAPRARWCWPASWSSRPTQPLAPAPRCSARCAAPTRRACSSPIDGFVGASPELLVARTGDLVRSHPMAGTAPRSADPSTDARLAADLLASAKDQVEHRYTIDMVHDTLLPWCSYLDEEAEPSIVAMANVQHLATLVEGRLSSPAGLGARADAGAAPHPGGERLAPRRGRSS